MSKKKSMQRITSASTDGLIANLYEAVFDPAMAVEFLQELAVRTESRAAHIAVFDNRSDAVLLDLNAGVVGSTPEELAEIRRSYDEVYAPIDYRRMHLTSLPVGEWYQCHEVFPVQRLRRERFFREFVLKWDLRYFTAIKMGSGGGLTTYLGLNRRAEQGPHDEQDMRFLKQLTIHLTRASKLFYKSRSFRSYLSPELESLQYLSSGVIILDRFQRVLFTNAAAEALFQSEPGFALNDGVLETAAHSLRKRFSEEVTKVINNGTPGAVLLKSMDGSRNSGMPCYLLKLPEKSDSYRLAGDPAVLVLVPQAQRNAPEAVALLRTLYSLSRREADLAFSIANGATPQDYARDAKLEISTVRSQLKSVFLKTGTHRQTELVRLLSVLPRIRFD